MIPTLALVLAFSVVPSTIASTSKTYISGNNTETLDLVSEKFTPRSLAGEYTLAGIPYALTLTKDGTEANLSGSIWLNSDRTFSSEFRLTSVDPARSPIRFKAKGEFYLDGNCIRLIPKVATVLSDRNEENISMQEIELTISPNGQVLQQIGKTGIFLVKK